VPKINEHQNYRKLHMAEIQEIGMPSRQEFKTDILDMADEELLAQDLVQQGAIHAVSFFITNGCNEETASQMLNSLRENAKLLRDEAERRGKPSLFKRDQTVFN